MVNTRILEQGSGWRQSGAQSGTGDGTPGSGPRALRHDPLLQGRVQSAGRPGAIVGPAGLTAPRNPQETARIAAAWDALPEIADSLEAAADRRGSVPRFDRTSANGIALDQLRSQILRVVADKGWRRLGLAAPRRGAGTSFMALGLAASFARLDSLNVALVDLDLSRPGLHDHLGLPAPGPLDEVLAGEVPMLEQVQRIGANLALVGSDSPAAQPAERLYSREAQTALRDLATALVPDVTLFDLPPLLTDPAAPAALPLVDAVLLIADGTRSTAREIADCERLLDGVVPLLGVALNKSEDAPRPGAWD